MGGGGGCCATESRSRTSRCTIVHRSGATRNVCLRWCMQEGACMVQSNRTAVLSVELEFSCGLCCTSKLRSIIVVDAKKTMLVLLHNLPPHASRQTTATTYSSVRSPKIDANRVPTLPWSKLLCCSDHPFLLLSPSVADSCSRFCHRISPRPPAPPTHTYQQSRRVVVERDGCRIGRSTRVGRALGWRGQSEDRTSETPVTDCLTHLSGIYFEASPDGPLHVRAMLFIRDYHLHAAVFFLSSCQKREVCEQGLTALEIRLRSIDEKNLILKPCRFNPNVTLTLT